MVFGSRAICDKGLHGASHNALEAPVEGLPLYLNASEGSSPGRDWRVGAHYLHYRLMQLRAPVLRRFLRDTPSFTRTGRPFRPDPEVKNNAAFILRFKR